MWEFPTPKTLLTDHIPLKQGLRPAFQYDFSRHFAGLTDHIPLKQGLRQQITARLKFFIFLTDHIPLKQGLRRVQLVPAYTDGAAHRPYSTKTRIKTDDFSATAARRSASHRPYSTKTRIKTGGTVDTCNGQAQAHRPYSTKTRIKTIWRRRPIWPTTSHSQTIFH